MPGTPLMLSMESPIKRQHVDHLIGPHAELLQHAVGVEPRALIARVEDADRAADELKEVLVAGDDRDVESGCRGLRRQRADHVVGLEPLAR